MRRMRPPMTLRAPGLHSLRQIDPVCVVIGKQGIVPASVPGDILSRRGRNDIGGNRRPEIVEVGMLEHQSWHSDALGYNPASTRSLRRFARIQTATECIFAPTANMWGCPDYDDRLSLPANLHGWLPLFTQFCRVSESLEIDGVVFELPGPFGDAVEKLGGTTFTILDYLSANDPVKAHCMEAKIEDATWWFSFAGEKLFVLAFGPCYPSTNSRYGFQTGRTYLVFQPVHCFSRRIPDGAIHKSRRTREEIRRRYTKAGRPYDVTITLSPYEAYRYVKPVQLGQPPVKWWCETD